MALALNDRFGTDFRNTNVYFGGIDKDGPGVRTLIKIKIKNFEIDLYSQKHAQGSHCDGQFHVIDILLSGCVPKTFQKHKKGYPSIQEQCFGVSGEYSE